MIINKIDLFDKETGVFCTPVFDFFLEYEIKRSFRYQAFATLVMLQPDRKVSHIESIGELVKVLKRNIRETDIIGRLNGYKFGIILIGADLDGAWIMAKRVLEHVNNYEFVKEPDKKLPVSIGGACFPTNSVEKNELMLMAEKMLKMAQKRGGNIICFPHLTEKIED